MSDGKRSGGLEGANEFHEETHEPAPITRRGFTGLTGLGALSVAMGITVPFAAHFPDGLIPVALANAPEPYRIPGKDPGMTILNDRPINAETPAHFLDDVITPAARFFVRNNGHPPTEVDPKSWSLKIDGESVEKAQSFSIETLKKQFKHHTYQLVLECGGNGRKEFFPPAKGNQWSTGAVGCVEWTGIRVKDLLQSCGIKKNAVYVAYEGADTHLSGAPDKKPISRGVPLAKAMEDQCLVAWAMNGQPIPALHGHPLRLVIPGMPGSCSGKWLNRIMIRDRVHDGTKMGGKAYRVPCDPVAPGTDVPDDEMCIIDGMPIKSLITFPKSGIKHALKQTLSIRGHAWNGDGPVQRVDVSYDFGATWQTTNLKKPKNPFAWQRFSAELKLPKVGYYEIWARATDANGKAQPMVLPGWNPKGYLNNACHRIAIRVTA